MSNIADGYLPMLWVLAEVMHVLSLVGTSSLSMIHHSVSSSESSIKMVIMILCNAFVTDVPRVFNY